MKINKLNYEILIVLGGFCLASSFFGRFKVKIPSLYEALILRSSTVSGKLKVRLKDE